MRPKVTLSKQSHLPELQRALKDIVKTDVLVGVPADKSSRPGEDINNAELLFIHTHGSPINNIPPRPVVEPAIAADGNRDIIADKLKDVAASVLEGNAHEAEHGLDVAGQTAVSLIKQWFNDPRNNWAPNAPETIRRKGSDHPLIDTGALRRSITWVIRKVK